MISVKDFLNNIKNSKAAFLVIINQSNFSKNSHVIHAMNIINEFFTSEEFSLSKKYENYTDIFSVKKIIKQNEFKNAEHSIDFISEKDSSYESIYNLFV